VDVGGTIEKKKQKVETAHEEKNNIVAINGS